MPIVVVDVTLQPGVQLLDIPEVREMEILGFQGGEEALHGRYHYVPRYVAVVGNLPDPSWTAALSAVDVQHLTVSVYRNRNGRSAHEIEGRLTVRAESLGFARYSAIDNCLRIPRGCGLPIGKIQIVDQFSNLADWTVREDAGVLWICKDRGPALIEHDSFMQIIRTFDGRISIRPSRC